MIGLIQNRLEGYNVSGLIEEENALKEIVQEIILFALWQADFFEVAAFQGGTSLRVLHGLTRFSEDIDFVLLEPNPHFKWQPYLKKLTQVCREFGIAPEALDKTRMDRSIQSALIKDNSIANQLNLSFIGNNNAQKLKIKLEIDTNPPAGSSFDFSYLDFPVDFEVCHQNLSSNFALKIHALLCRPYLKGRDWYDFSWYVTQNAPPNWLLLSNAIEQYGPWKGKNIYVDRNWLINILTEKMTVIKWDAAALDVKRFLNSIEQKSLSLWNMKFFMNKLNKLKE